MKKNNLLAGILLTGCIVLSFAGKTQRIPSYIPSNGFWMIVSHINVNNEATVQCYNDEQVLIYEEKISGRKLNLKRKKTLRCLKVVLDQVLAAFNADKHEITDKHWIAAAIK